MRTMPDVNEIAGCAHQAFGHEKASRQLVIFARRSHDDRNAVVFNSDFQRLFGGQEISFLAAGGTVHPPHRNFSDSAARKGGAFHETPWRGLRMHQNLSASPALPRTPPWESRRTSPCQCAGAP